MIDGDVNAGEVRIPDRFVQLLAPAGEDCQTYCIPEPGVVPEVRFRAGDPLQLYEAEVLVAVPAASGEEHEGVNR